MISLEGIAFADGRYRFALTLKLVLEIERECGVTDREGVHRPKSIYRIHDELSAGLGLDNEEPVYLGGGDAHAKDIRAVIFAGLRGGNSGMVAGEEMEVGPQKATQLCDDFLFPNRPLIEGQYLAWSILDECIRGVSLKKKAEQPKAGSPSRSTEASSSPTAANSGSTGNGSRSATTRRPSKRAKRPAKNQSPT